MEPERMGGIPKPFAAGHDPGGDGATRQVARQAQPPPRHPSIPATTAIRTSISV